MTQPNTMQPNTTRTGPRADAEDMEDIRASILYAMLPNTVFDGWTRSALNAGVRDAGFDETMARRAFPQGLAEVAGLWSRQSDRAMVAALGEQDLQNMRVRDRIATGVKARILVNADNREALRCCMSWLALPPNVSTGMKNALCTVSEIWYATGDRSTDWNYYSKRGLLLLVYSSTVLYWLADTPDDNGDYPETWGYLDRRIDDVLKTFGLPRKIRENLKNTGNQGFGPFGVLSSGLKFHPRTGSRL